MCVHLLVGRKSFTLLPGQVHISDVQVRYWLRSEDPKGYWVNSIASAI